MHIDSIHRGKCANAILEELVSIYSHLHGIFCPRNNVSGTSNCRYLQVKKMSCLAYRMISPTVTIHTSHCPMFTQLHAHTHTHTHTHTSIPGNVAGHMIVLMSTQTAPCTWAVVDNKRGNNRSISCNKGFSAVPFSSTWWRLPGSLGIMRIPDTDTVT